MNTQIITRFSFNKLKKLEFKENGRRHGVGLPSVSDY